MSYAEGFEPTAYISRRKMARKVQEQVERFAWSKSEGRLIPDKRGDIVFLRDVVKIIEGSSLAHEAPGGKA